jgi:hypothetical protein
MNETQAKQTPVSLTEDEISDLRLAIHYMAHADQRSLMLDTDSEYAQEFSDRLARFRALDERLLQAAIRL